MNIRQQELILDVSESFDTLYGYTNLRAYFLVVIELQLLQISMVLAVLACWTTLFISDNFISYHIFISVYLIFI